jgi:HPt (histidine-containing phosphotransfer) domain-containing protein
VSEFEDAFQQLRLRFLGRCQTDRAALEAHLAGPALAPAELRLILHRLSGAAGTFGLGDLSERAGAAEDACLEQTPDTDERVRAVVGALASSAAGH